MHQIRTNGHFIRNSYNLVVNGHSIHNRIRQGALVIPSVKPVCQILKDSHIVELAYILWKSPDQIRNIAAGRSRQDLLVKHIISKVCLVYLIASLFFPLRDLLCAGLFRIRAFCPTGPQFYRLPAV